MDGACANLRHGIAQILLTCDLCQQAIVGRVECSQFRVRTRPVTCIVLNASDARSEGLCQFRDLALDAGLTVRAFFGNAPHQGMRHGILYVRGIPINPCQGTGVVRLLTCLFQTTLVPCIEDGVNVHRPTFRERALHRIFPRQGARARQLFVICVHGFLFTSLRVKRAVLGGRFLPIKGDGGTVNHEKWVCIATVGEASERMIQRRVHFPFVHR